MKRTQWVSKKQHAAETVRCGDGAFWVVIHDDAGRRGEGFGKTEELAFKEAHEQYTANARRAVHTTKRYDARQFTARTHGGAS